MYFVGACRRRESKEAVCDGSICLVFDSIFVATERQASDENEGVNENFCLEAREAASGDRKEKARLPMRMGIVRGVLILGRLRIFAGLISLEISICKIV